MYTPRKDDIYAYALSKTLTKVSSPATVGLYSSCQNRINMILGQMEVYMEEEAVRIEKEYKGRPRSVKPSFTGFLTLIGRLLFYRPIWTKDNQQHHDIRFIYVHFSAWHFAGSDLLWAGLAIRLFQAMQINFGKLQLVLYRVAQHDEEEEIKKKIVENGTNHWRSKKICCCPLWFLVLSILVVPVILLVLLFIFGLPKPEVIPGEEVNETNGQLGMLEGLVIAALGLPAASALRFTFLMGKNLIFTQDLNIKKGMDNEQDLKIFEVATVNLDHTVKKELAQIRGTSRLKDSGWMRDLAPLPITTIINMDTEDVCKELERMKYPTKYIEIVKCNDLNGSALLFGNADDLKDLLGMTFGEWATFRLHFLGLPSHLRPQYKNMPLAPSHPQNQLLRISRHVRHHYSSNPNAVTSFT